MKNIYLSVVIPAYNEERRIEQTLNSIEKYLINESYEYEIIVVDDGSSDNTKKAIQGLSRSIKSLRLISYSKNQGKGYAVKRGMLEAVGKCRLFMDADGSTSIDQIEKLLPFLYEKFDIVVSSRRVDGSNILIEQPKSRIFLGWIFRIITNLLFNTGIKDTQNGFKLFKAEIVRDIFPKLNTNGWAFDIEILALANKAGLRIKEVPITWTDNANSSVRFSGMVKMLIDLIRIKIKMVL